MIAAGFAPFGRLECRFTPAGIQAALRALLLLQALGFAFMVAGTHGVFAPQTAPPTTTDFASFYAAGRLASQGRPSAAYSPVDHLTAERQAVAPGVDEKRFLNPPVFLLLCAPLARLPYLPAFLLFEAATACVWLALVTRIAGGGTLAALGMAAIPSVWWTLGWGQNAFLSAGLMGAGTALLRRRPWLAGAAFGALCFKPHFGILIPVALVAGRHWRALAGATASLAVLTGLSAICFGVAAWKAFAGAAFDAGAAVQTSAQLAARVDLRGAARLLGMALGPSWAFQAAGTLAAAAVVAWLWARAPATHPLRPGRHEAACAGLVAGTLAAMPFVLFYDLVMAGVAAAWLVRAARSQGWRVGEWSGLGICLALDLFAYPAACSLHLAIAAAVSPILLWLAVDRSRSVKPSVAI